MNENASRHNAVWSPFWIDACDGPELICEKCLKHFQHSNIIFGEDALLAFREVILFVKFDEPEFELTKGMVLATGELIDGEPNGLKTLMGRALYCIKEDYWIVTLFSLLQVSKKFISETKLEWY